MTASKIPPLEAKKLFESFEVMDASVQQTAGTQSFFFSPSKVVFYRYYAIYELSLRVAVIKFISFDPENSGASITVFRCYVGQLPGPESPCIVSFPSAGKSFTDPPSIPVFFQIHVEYLQTAYVGY